jgi:hypothetical protein
MSTSHPGEELVHLSSTRSTDTNTTRLKPNKMEAPKANYGPKTKSLNSKASIPYDLLTVHPLYFVWFEVIYQEHIIT